MTTSPSPPRKRGSRCRREAAGFPLRGNDDVLLLLLFAAPAAAQTFPKLTGRVVDQANLLRPAQERRPHQQVRGARGADRAAVRGRDRPQPRRAADRGLRLSARPRTGRSATRSSDDGVILLVAPNERKVRIETGYGARVFLTDAVSSVIIRECDPAANSRPATIGGGITAGADAIIKQMSLSAGRGAAPGGARPSRREQARAEAGRRLHPGRSSGCMIILFVIAVDAARARGGRRYRRRSAAAGSTRWSCCGASTS